MLREKKFNDVISGARAVFFEHGFAGARVDQIADVAGVSKATMYAYFPTKTALFIEVVSRECDMLAEELETLLRTQGPMEKTLQTFSGALIGLVFSNAYIRLYRICVAEAGRSPEIGELFFKAGPERVRLILARYLEDQCGMGEVLIPDTDFAADQFIQLSFTRILTDRLFGIQKRIYKSVISKSAKNATRAFLAIYAASPGTC